MRTSFILLLSFLFATSLNAQERQFLKDEFYLKVIDDYDLSFNTQSQEVDVARQLPFLEEYVEFFGLSAVRSFYFAEQYNRLLRTFRVRIKDAEQTEIFLRLIRQEEEVEYVQRITTYQTIYEPNDYRNDDYCFSNDSVTWHLDRIQAREAWDITQGNRDILVAVIDNGFYEKHPDLARKWEVFAGADVADFDDDPFTWDERFWHGTHVAGIIGAETNNGDGLASIGFNTGIMPVKATFDACPDPELITSGLEGIMWAINNNADVINLSWGYKDGAHPEELEDYTLREVMEIASWSNIPIIAAAGNQSSEEFFYPAILDHIIAVANTNAHDKKAPSSNYGDWIDICAPGENIFSTYHWGGYECESGTSMSAPIVAGTAALMLSLDPSLTPTDIVNCMQSTAEDIGALNGYMPGIKHRLNTYRALQCVLDQQVNNDEGEEEEEINLNFQMSPNPMRAKTVVSYELPEVTKIYLNIYDQWGRLVAQPISPQIQMAGNYKFVFERPNVRMGNYYCKLITSYKVESKILTIY